MSSALRALPRTLPPRHIAIATWLVLPLTSGSALSSQIQLIQARSANNAYHYHSTSHTRLAHSPRTAVKMSASGSGNDQYSAQSGASPSLTEKLSALRGFLGKHKTVMLTTHAPDGSLHSRCMVPAEITKDWRFRFIYDCESYKDTEIGKDRHVNIAVDGMEKSDGWASIAGRANRTNEEGLVAKLYNPTIKAWFGDKGDGVHTGEPSDPRMAVLEVKVDEIRHYHQQKTAVGVAVDVVASAISGKTATPGEIRTIKGEEIQGAWEKGQLKEP